MFSPKRWQMFAMSARSYVRRLAPVDFKSASLDKFVPILDSSFPNRGARTPHYRGSSTAVTVELSSRMQGGGSGAAPAPMSSAAESRLASSSAACSALGRKRAPICETTLG